MINVIIRKSSHCEVAVIVVRLKPDIDALLLSDFLRSGDEVLWEKLVLFVEVVTSALRQLVWDTELFTNITYHIYQDIQRPPLPVFQQFRRIVFSSLLFPILLAEVAFERLFSPWCL